MKRISSRIRRQAPYIYKQEITSLLCPQCGAPVKHHARDCEYCGAAVVRKKPHLAVAADGKGLALRDRCPRCHHKLTHIKLNAGEVSQCRHCGGTWVPNRTLHLLNKSARTEKRTLKYINSRKGNPEDTEALNMHQRVRCPKCGRTMTPTTFGKRVANNPPMVADICRQHGYWFDEEEMWSIGPVMYMASFYRNHDFIRGTSPIGSDLDGEGYEPYSITMVLKGLLYVLLGNR